MTIRLRVITLGIAFLLIGGSWYNSTSSVAVEGTPGSVSEQATSVSVLSTTVSSQSTRISDLETSVAEISSLLASPIATPEPQTLTVTIELSAKPADIEATTEGEPCAGAGKFANLGPKTEIAIYNADEVLLVTSEFVGSELTRAGTIFSDCRLEFVVEEIPFESDYIFEIPGRSVMTLSYEELEAEEWSLDLRFGP